MNMDGMCDKYHKIGKLRPKDLILKKKHDFLITYYYKRKKKLFKEEGHPEIIFFLPISNILYIGNNA